MRSWGCCGRRGSPSTWCDEAYAHAVNVAFLIVVVAVVLFGLFVLVTTPMTTGALVVAGVVIVVAVIEAVRRR